MRALRHLSHSYSGKTFQHFLLDFCHQMWDFSRSQTCSCLSKILSKWTKQLSVLMRVRLTLSRRRQLIWELLISSDSMYQKWYQFTLQLSFFFCREIKWWNLCNFLLTSMYPCKKKKCCIYNIKGNYYLIFSFFNITSETLWSPHLVNMLLPLNNSPL